MCRGLPTMLSCFLPGQEAGNVPFVTEGGFGDYSKDPDTIASTVASWMRDPAKVRGWVGGAAMIACRGTSCLPRVITN